MLYACENDFLETLPKASANEVILANEKGVNMLLIGAYAALDGSTGMGGEWAASVSNWIWGDVASDDCAKGTLSGSLAPVIPIENYTVVPSNAYVSDKWRADYEGISRTNAVLRVLAKCDPPLSAEAQASIKAQALFLRAYIHFDLKKVFNNIPYITETVDPVLVPNNVDAWPMIESDLQFAVDNLPTVQSEVGRPTKYAAEALLAKAYIFQKKWEEARVLLDDIIANSGKSLMNNFGDNFDAAYRNNKESIWEIQYTVNDGSNGSLNGGNGDRGATPIAVDGLPNGWGWHQPTQNLVNAFMVDNEGLPIFEGSVSNFKNDMNILSTEYFAQDTVTPVDPRLDLTIGRRGVPYLDYGIMRGSTWIRQQDHAGPYLDKKKMFKKSQIGTLSDATGSTTNAINYRVLRFSHILLWRAEVAVESSTPDLAYATTLVNMIRSRANNQKVMGRCRTFILPNQTGLNVDYTAPAANYLVSTYPTDFPSVEYARKAIQMETRLEFALEGHRHFDLVRWGIAAATINAYLDQDRDFRTLFGGTNPAVFTENKNEFWPIPQTEIDLQQGVLVQNPGY
jgi:hypothetical protein